MVRRELTGNKIEENHLIIKILPSKKKNCLATSPSTKWVEKNDNNWYLANALLIDPLIDDLLVIFDLSNQ